MLIDFAAAHKTYLQGRSEQGQWVFNLANPGNPRAWKHLASHQIFSNHALGIALAVRNEVSDTGKATAAFTGLRLSFSSKVNGRYPLMQDPGKISVTLGIEGVRYLYSWLRGYQSTFSYDLVRRDKAPISLSGFESDSHFTHTLRATTTAVDGAQTRIDVGLNAGDTFSMTMFCVGFAQLLYPSITSDLVASHLLVAGTPERTSAQEPPQPHHSHAKGSLAESQGSQPLEECITQPASLERSKVQRAIYAVGMSKWKRQNLQVIEYIQQTASIERMDELIKAGNRGDFSGWENLEALMAGNFS
ncbi:MAG: hypothetical protein CMK74_06450 [Pseudomonadales bacterium]|nr:hypothetical protein [Pseudomonadales bacterium]